MLSRLLGGPGEKGGSHSPSPAAYPTVCFGETKEDAQQVQHILSEGVKGRGLTLSQEKTRMVHLTEGCDFLSFNLKHSPAPQTCRTGWKLLSKPSKEAVQAVQKKLKDLWDKAQGSHVQSVLSKLNPVMGGWANDFRTVVATETVDPLDNWMFFQAPCYARKRHPNTSKEWRNQK